MAQPKHAHFKALLCITTRHLEKLLDTKEKERAAMDGLYCRLAAKIIVPNAERLWSRNERSKVYAGSSEVKFSITFDFGNELLAVRNDWTTHVMAFGSDPIERVITTMAIIEAAYDQCVLKKGTRPIQEKK